MPVVNIGILAHVDAGKTSLTERLLFETGAIPRLGSVDAGTTQTDTGEIERRRGITIKSAVAALRVGDLRVDLIDTPGHSDFVAEVERALGVLDGAVLVLSAVEGVQAHTRVLMKTLRRLRLPTLVFVNKIDRSGARDAGLLADIRRLLTPFAVPVAGVRDIGTPAAHAFRIAPDLATLAELDDALLADFVEDREPDEKRLWTALADLTAAGRAYPVFFGSAMTGEGVPELIEGIRDLLPRAAGVADAEPDGTVFAIQRGAAGEKTAYVRMRDGLLRNRDKTGHGQVTALEVVGRPESRAAGPGDIAKIRGLPGVRVGDRIRLRTEGTAAAAAADRTASGAQFAAPTLETVVRAADGDRIRLHAALVTLADQDPLIRTRVLPGGESSILLYGEVQKEVIATTLADEFGVAALFEPSRTVYLERPVGTGEWIEDATHFPSTRWPATVGLRVDPAPPGTGQVFRYETELGALPYAFHRAIEETVHKTLAQGLSGWEVTDVQVTLIRSRFFPPGTVAGHFRDLTPFVLMQALRRAGTAVYEPCHAFELEIPTAAVSGVLAHLAAHEAEVTDSAGGPASWTLAGSLPARTVQGVERGLPALTSGEAVWLAHASGDRLVRGTPPVRERTDGNPLDLVEYLRHLALQG
jgi:ribosomal protection tetracycline resistance protein